MLRGDIFSDLLGAALTGGFIIAITIPIIRLIAASREDVGDEFSDCDYRTAALAGEVALDRIYGGGSPRKQPSAGDAHNRTSHGSHSHVGERS